MVTVFNDRGTVTLKAKVHDGMRPGCVCVGEGWRIRDFAKGHYNELTDNTLIPAQEAVFETMAQMQGVIVEVRKAEEG